MKKATFKGYILEIILSYLIKNSGYTIITKAPLGDSMLRNKGNGLNIRGRGGEHQVDVLGEFKQIPAFSFPLRILVEAKFRTDVIGPNVIRSKIGLVKDVNENYFSLGCSMPYIIRYNYIGAIFSTSGFSPIAADLAIAHQISIVDLSDQAYDYIKNRINEFSDVVFGNSNDIASSVAKTIRQNLINRLLFESLEETTYSEYINTLSNSLSGQELLVGMSIGGILLLMKPSNYQDFIVYAKQNPNHKIRITWRSVETGYVRTIKPYNSEAYELKFKLPQSLHDIIYNTPNSIYEESLNVKREYFKHITVYHSTSAQDYIFNLEYNDHDIHIP